MPYTPTGNLEAMIESLRQPRPRTSYASGLAEGIRGLSATYLGKKLESRQAQNEELKKQEMQMLINALSGAQAPMKPGQTPNFQHPDVQQLALANALKTGQMTKEAQLRAQNPTGSLGNTPITLQNPETGQYGLARMAPTGLDMLDLPEGFNYIPDSGRMGFDPSMIAQRGGAETDVQVDRTEQLSPVEAAAAAETATAVGAAETETLLDRQRRMYGQERLQELEENRSKAWSRTTAKEDQNQLLTGLIGKARNQASAWTTGFLGSATEKIPGTPAFDLVSTLDTIRANIGFDKLQEMRDNSPTGGALGQVSEQENRLLQAVWGNLENSQSREQFLENLQLVEDQVARSWERINEAYQADYGVPYFEPNANGSGPNDEIFSQADAILNGN